MKTSLRMAVVALAFPATDFASAQSGNMMSGGGGWMWGYGGMWMPILLVVAVAGLVVWIVKRK